MGQSLRLETPAQDPQKHSNGGEFLDSLFYKLWALCIPFLLFCSHLMPQSKEKRVWMLYNQPCTVSSPPVAPSLSPPQRMLNHWDHVDKSQLCFYTLAYVAHLLSYLTVRRKVTSDIGVMFSSLGTSSGRRVCVCWDEILHKYWTIPTIILLIIAKFHIADCKQTWLIFNQRAGTQWCICRTGF